MYVIILILNAELRDRIKNCLWGTTYIEYSPWHFSIIFENTKFFNTRKSLKRSMKLFSIVGRSTSVAFASLRSSSLVSITIFVYLENQQRSFSDGRSNLSHLALWKSEVFRCCAHFWIIHTRWTELSFRITVQSYSKHGEWHGGYMNN